MVCQTIHKNFVRTLHDSRHLCIKMYVFIPEHFLAQKLEKGVRIFAQTYLCKGVRFLSNQGRWVLQNHSNNLYSENSDQTHWLYILHTYSNLEERRKSNDVTNALVFWENSRIILEIIHQIKYGMIIQARFHNISLEDIVTITESNNNCFNNSISEPLDLSKTLSNNANIVGVKKIVGRKRKQMLPCDLCGKEFDRPSLLKRHIRTHTGERPHECEICGKGFSTSSSLNTHKRIHSGERPHQCNMCGKRFTASSNLYYHRLTHSAEKPHKCDVCGKSFPTPGNLRSHKYAHGGLSPYKCTICLRVFTKQTNLKNHLNVHHKH